MQKSHDIFDFILIILNALLILLIPNQIPFLSLLKMGCHFSLGNLKQCFWYIKTKDIWKPVLPICDFTKSAACNILF